MAVYLLHFDVPLLRSDGTPVAHYVGHAEDGEVLRRVYDHLRGRHPAKLVQALMERNTRVWIGNQWNEQGREYERRLKQMGHLSRRCYRCKMLQVGREWTEALAEGSQQALSGGGLLRKHVDYDPRLSTGGTKRNGGG